MVNTELIRKVLGQVTTMTWAHDQTQWESLCGTTRCFFGWGAVIATRQHSLDKARELLEELYWDQHGHDGSVKRVALKVLAAELFGFPAAFAEAILYCAREDLVVEIATDVVGIAEAREVTGEEWEEFTARLKTVPDVRGRSWSTRS